MESVTIGKRNSMYDRIAWVARARSDDPTRGFLTVVHVEARTERERQEADYPYIAVASDGKRLHAALVGGLAELSPGEYTVAKGDAGAIVLNPAKNTGTFPVWRKVVPAIQDDPIPLDIGKVKGVALGYTAFRLAKQTGAPFDVDFLKDLMGESWEVSAKDAQSAHRFDNHVKLAVIMPMAIPPDLAQNA